MLDHRLEVVSQLVWLHSTILVQKKSVEMYLGYLGLEVKLEQLWLKYEVELMCVGYPFPLVVFSLTLYLYPLHSPPYCKHSTQRLQQIDVEHSEQLLTIDFER